MDAYIDNFVLLQQGTIKMRRNALRALFHTIDKVILPNDAEDNTRTEPNSTKKLKLGEGSFFKCKKVLSWVFDHKHF